MQVKADRHVADELNIEDLQEHTKKVIQEVHEEPGKVKATTQIQEEFKTG